mmetsp:Transcript_74024/g.173800  ORF Transcript_74024/g.173800 Transcript_74024/m.173800 type:complete len:155 (-) Transcript_74024:51-515(-)
MSHFDVLVQTLETLAEERPDLTPKVFLFADHPETLPKLRKYLPTEFPNVSVISQQQDVVVHSGAGFNTYEAMSLKEYRRGLIAAFVDFWLAGELDDMILSFSSTFGSLGYARSFALGKGGVPTQVTCPDINLTDTRIAYELSATRTTHPWFPSN